MKHRHTRHLHSYWSTLRGEAAAPLRGAIEPADIREVLGDTFILENAPPAAHIPFRLAGTRLCALYGRELKGRSFLGLWSEKDMDAMATLLEAIASDAAAAVLGVETFNERGQSVPSEMLLLPLSRGGRIYDRVLGLMVPIEKPYWLGLHPIIRQSIVSLRLIWPDEHPMLARAAVGAGAAPFPAAVPEELLVAGRKRRHLVVLDGGRA